MTYAAPQLASDGRPLNDAQGRAAVAVATARTQTLPMGPVASQTAAALLSGDGGGYFNANSAHPFANPTPFSNFLQMLAILLIPAALCHTFGKAVGDTRQGWAILAAMAAAFVLMSTGAIEAEQAGNGLFAQFAVNQSSDLTQAGGNMEGKEVRFGIVSSALFATATTSGGDGAVNSMHDSFAPLGGLVPMALMQLGEVIFGGPGSGLYGMLLYAILAAFVAALMIGRAPEYLGKKIDIFEMKMASLAILVTPFLVLTGTALGGAFASRPCGRGEPWCTRLRGDSLRLLIHREQQRQRLCRAGRQLSFLQRDYSRGDVVRTFRSITGGTRHRGFSGRQAPSRAGTGNASHAWSLCSWAYYWARC